MRVLKYIVLILACVCDICAQGASFQYPAMPDTLRSADARVAYLLQHYWDNFDFTDTLQLNDADNVEQGFVNYIDLLTKLTPNIDNGKLKITSQATLKQSVAAFSEKAFASAEAKTKFESLIDHYLDDPQSPMRDDRTYVLFLEQMTKSAHFSNTEKDRATFKLNSRNRNLPGSTALDFTFTDNNGNVHSLKEYAAEKVILYFYDPDCDNCHKVSAWLDRQTISPAYTFLRIKSDERLTDLYSLEAMPTIFLLDKGNTVVLKDCTAETLIQTINGNVAAE